MIEPNDCALEFLRSDIWLLSTPYFNFSFLIFQYHRIREEAAKIHIGICSVYMVAELQSQVSAVGMHLLVISLVVALATEYAPRVISVEASGRTQHPLFFLLTAERQHRINHHLGHIVYLQHRLSSVVKGDDANQLLISRLLVQP